MNTPTKLLLSLFFLIMAGCANERAYRNYEDSLVTVCYNGLWYYEDIPGLTYYAVTDGEGKAFSCRSNY